MAHNATVNKCACADTHTYVANTHVTYYIPTQGKLKFTGPCSKEYSPLHPFPLECGLDEVQVLIEPLPEGEVAPTQLLLEERQTRNIPRRARQHTKGWLTNTCSSRLPTHTHTQSLVHTPTLALVRQFQMLGNSGKQGQDLAQSSTCVHCSLHRTCKSLQPKTTNQVVYKFIQPSMAFIFLVLQFY